MRMVLQKPEALYFRFSVWLICGKCGNTPCNFIGHAMGWIEAQKLVKDYQVAIFAMNELKTTLGSNYVQHLMGKSPNEHFKKEVM